MGGGTKVSTTENKPWDAQIEPLKYGFSETERLYKKGAPAYYSGETVAGFDPSQEAAQKATLGYAMGPRAAAQQASAEKNIQQMQTGEIDSSTFDPMIDMYKRNAASALDPMLAKIRSDQVLYQPGGGSRGDIAVGNAASSVGDKMLDNIAKMQYQAYGDAQGRRTQALGAYPTIMGAPMGMYNSMADVGAQRRAMSQEGINRGIQEHAYTSQADQTALANYMAGIHGDYGGMSTSKTPGPSGMSTIGSLAGIVGNLAPVFGMSDERLKENIEQVGVLNGFNIYRFNYLWSPKKFIGVIAQEVERIMPEAVKKVNGWRMVNYGVLF
jgi:hypothetical protein